MRTFVSRLANIVSTQKSIIKEQDRALQSAGFAAVDAVQADLLKSVKSLTQYGLACQGA